MLTITCPDHCVREAEYALDVVLGDFMGLSYQTKTSTEEIFRLEHEGCSLTIGSHFFPALAMEKAQELMNKPVALWDSRKTGWQIALIDPDVPVLFGEPVIEQGENHIHIGIDIFGSTFFMLSRYEETICDRRDLHGRFPAREAMAYRHGFLLRPIIDEYVEILWAAMSRLWPQLARKKRHFETVPTHDVDDPYMGLSFDSLKQFARRCGGDLVKRKNPSLAARTAHSYVRAHLPGTYKPAGDPFNVFDELMALSEQADIKSRFYFMTDWQRDHFYGGRYDIGAPHIMALVKKISTRGHEIGIHPTGDSYMQGAAFSLQAGHLDKALRNAGIVQKTTGGRQHYLRWQAAVTPKLWNDAGFDYDSSLTYAEHVGFRCGTAHAFPLWDFQGRKALNVKEHPLIMMEGSLIGENYMGQNMEQALATIKKLRNAVRLVEGRFVFLWHNSSLLTPVDWQLYRACLGQSE